MVMYNENGEGSESTGQGVMFKRKKNVDNHETSTQHSPSCLTPLFFIVHYLYRDKYMNMKVRCQKSSQIINNQYLALCSSEIKLEVKGGYMQADV
jgi:hypothetical protein